jgi:16S rRNA A1518/A1519 N6-dimethyltransferase RsmA/KsgA/DIM1 with predicted DNA glycosylase/AP lyase activity
MPRVRSAVVRLTFRPPVVALGDESRFERLVRSLFTRRRKMLLNALRPFADEVGTDSSRLLANAGIDARRRPETLQVTELARLAEQSPSS